MATTETSATPTQLQVIRVIRLGDKNARVLLSNNQVAKIPTSFLSSETISSSELVQDPSSPDLLIHTSLVRTPRKPRVPILTRDMSQFDATAELATIASLVRRHAPQVFGRHLSSSEVSELSEELFLHFWERYFFQGYNPKKCPSYVSYLSRGVKNFLIDKKRKKSNRIERRTLSLDANLPSDDTNFTLLELLADPTEDTYEKVEVRLLIDAMWREVDILDCEGTGIDVSYRDIFNSLLGKGEMSFDELAASSHYSATTVRARKVALLQRLRPLCKEYLAC